MSNMMSDRVYKKIMLLAIFLLFKCNLFSQNRFVVWNDEGTYLFEAKDSQKLIAQLERQDDGRFQVLTNPSDNINYRNFSVTFFNFLMFCALKSDSIRFITPTVDSIPNGKWYEMEKLNNHITLRVIKEVFDNKLENKRIIYPGNGKIVENFKNGFPVGRVLYKDFKGKILNDCLYSDSFNYYVYNKTYDPKTGKLIHYYDLKKMYYAEYFPNGQICKKCQIDKYSNFNGKMEIYLKTGKLKAVEYYLDGKLIKK